MKYASVFQDNVHLFALQTKIKHRDINEQDGGSYLLIGLTIFMTVLVLVCPFALDRLEHEDSLGRVAKMLLFTFVALILFLTLGIRSFDGNRTVNFRLFQCYRGLLNQFLYNWKTYKSIITLSSLKSFLLVFVTLL